MVRGIPIKDLYPETLEKLGINVDHDDELVDSRLIALGRVFRALKGIKTRNALWALEQAQIYVQNQNDGGVVDYKALIEEVDAGNYTPPIGWTIHQVAKAFQLKPSDLKQRGRKANVALARQVAFYILCMTNEYTLSQIGHALGDRSPATVSHGFQRIASQVNGDSNLKGKISEIHSRLLLE